MRLSRTSVKLKLLYDRKIGTFGVSYIVTLNVKVAMFIAAQTQHRDDRAGLRIQVY